jgi:hypothetical protein
LLNSRQKERSEKMTVTKTEIQYVEYRSLQCRGAVDPLPDEEVTGTLLVATHPALQYVADEGTYGHNFVSILPAFYNGERSWLKREEWEAAYGYSASGTSEEIISFEDGVKIFLEHGVFNFPLPE